jgi:hypothetical protein
VQSRVTAHCFAYGRTTTSVDGGACNVRGLACYGIVTPVWRAHYMPPEMLAGLMAPRAGQWRDVQFHRFMRRAPRHPPERVRVVDPATAAKGWGRIPS